MLSLAHGEVMDKQANIILMLCGKAQGRAVSRWLYEAGGAFPGPRESARESFRKPVALKSRRGGHRAGLAGDTWWARQAEGAAEQREEALKQAGRVGEYKPRFCPRMKGKGGWSGG